MWIERIEIDGFRGLSGEFTFAPKLNLVVGENEAGKSTLHEALIRSLFGFTAGERRRSRGTSVRDACKPWDGRPFALIASVRDAGGRDYRIEWDFGAHRVRFLEGGKDRSADVRGRNDEVTLGQFLLDIELEDFRQVCCIDQVALEAVRSSSTLGLALQEAVAQIGGDVAAQDVVARLEQFLRESIGARVDNLAPTAKGRLGSLLSEKAEVTRQITDAIETRGQIEALATDLERNRGEHDRMATDIETARQALLLTERDGLRAKAAEAGRLEALSQARAVVPEAPPQAVIDQIRAAHVRLVELAEAIDREEAAVETARAEVETLELSDRTLDAQLADLASYLDVDVSSRDTVRSAIAERDALRATIVSAPEALPERDPSLEGYRRERQELYALAAGEQSWTARRVLWIALVVVSLGLALLIRALVRRLRGSTQEPGELQRRLGEYDAQTLAELDERGAEEDRAMAAAQARIDLATTQAAEHETRFEALEQTIVGALDTVDAPAAPDVDKRAAAYLLACDKHEQRLPLDLEQQRIRNRLQELRRPKQTHQDLVAERETVERQLRGRYAGLELGAEELATAREELEGLLQRIADAEATNRKADTAAESLTTLLDGSTREALADGTAEAERQLEEHVARHGRLAADAGDASALRRQIAELSEEATHTRDRVTELQTRIGDLEGMLGTPAELEERLDELNRQIARLERAKKAVGIARDAIWTAADELNREFQPHLREALKRNLPRITGGRYADAAVDGDLRVQVVVPGVGRQVPAEQLSRATRDQIFLVQRLEIARLLAPAKGAAPLILDDPFAHYDAKRLRFALELLHEAAEERQIIVFSEDAELPGLAASVAGDSNVIELPATVGT